jgi:translocation and assembly module TamB
MTIPERPEENPIDEKQQAKSSARRRRLLIGGFTFGGVVIGAAAGTTWFLQQKFVPMIQDTVGQLLQRPIELGQLSDMQIGYLKFGPTTVPPTADNPDYAKVAGIEIRFSIAPLLARNLPLDIKLLDSRVYIQQRSDGSFVVPELAVLPPGPVNVQPAKIAADRVLVTVQPQLQANGQTAIPINLTLNDIETKFQDDAQRILVDLQGKFDTGGKISLNADIDNAKISPPVAKTKLKLNASNLLIPELARLASNPDVQLLSGLANTNLNLQIKNNDIEKIQGTANFSNIQAQVTGIRELINISLDSQIDDQNNQPKITIKNFTTIWPNSQQSIVFNLKGDVITGENLAINQSQFNLQAGVNPINVQSAVNLASNQINYLLKTAFPPNSTVAKSLTPQVKTQLFDLNQQIAQNKNLVAGQLLVNTKITGSMPQPVINTSLQTQGETVVDKIAFSQINTDVQVIPQFDQNLQLLATAININNLNILPIAGGSITGKGSYNITDLATKPNIKSDNNNSNTATKPTVNNRNNQSPAELNLDLQISNLPVDYFAGAYNTEIPVTLGKFSANTNITGPLDQLQGKAKWQLTEGAYPASGAVNIVNSNATLENTVINIADGNILINGNANFNTWQLGAIAQKIDLQELARLIPNSQVQVAGLLNGNVNLAGNSKNFNANTLQGKSNINMAIATGNININSEINNGRWQSQGQASNINLSILEQLARSNNPDANTPVLFATADNTLNGDFNLTGNVNNPSQVNGNWVGNFNFAGDLIRATGQLNQGNFTNTIQADNIAINPLLNFALAFPNNPPLNTPVTIADIQNLNGKLTTNINVTGNIDELIIGKIDIDLDTVVSIPEATITATGQLRSGDLQARVNTNSIVFSDIEKVLRKTRLIDDNYAEIFHNQNNGSLQANINLAGNVNKLPEKLNIQADSQLTTQGGNINIKAKALNNIWRANVVSENLALSPLINLGEAVIVSGLAGLDKKQVNAIKPQLTALQSLDSQLDLNADLTGSLTNFSANNINADADSLLTINNQRITAKATVNNGNLVTNIQSDVIPLNSLQAIALQAKIINQPIFAGQPQGSLASNLSITGNLANLNINTINASGNSQLMIADNAINAKGNIQAGEFLAEVTADPVSVSQLQKAGFVANNLTPNPVNTKISGQASIAGVINSPTPQGITAEGRGNFAIDGNNINATTTINNGLLIADLKTDVISVNALENLAKQAGLITTAFLPPNTTGTITTTANIQGDLTKLTPDQIIAQANSQLIIDDQVVNATANLQAGAFDLRAIAQPIPLSFVEKVAQSMNLLPAEYVTNMPGLITGNIFAEGNLSDTNLEKIATNLDGKIIFDEGGVINIAGTLKGNNWQTNITSEQVALNPFNQILANLPAENLATINGLQQTQNLLTNSNVPLLNGVLNGQINLFGNLTNLTPLNIRGDGQIDLSQIPVLQDAFTSAFNWDGKKLNVLEARTNSISSDGFIAVNFPNNNQNTNQNNNQPNINEVNFNIQLSDFDLGRLPVQALTANLSPQQQVQMLAGRVNFAGQVTGDLANLKLNGDVRLNDLAVNNITFDPILAGSVTGGLQQGLNIDINGNINDRIALVLNDKFLPESFLLQHDHILAEGISQGENFQLALKNFPLDILAINPSPDLGIGTVKGDVSGQLTISQLATFDPAQITAQGQVTIDQPSFGYIAGKKFTGQLNYGNGQASLDDGELTLQNSRILLAGNVDLGKDFPQNMNNFNPQFAGKVTIAEGELQDILVAMQWFDLNDLSRGIRAPIYGVAKDLEQTYPIVLPGNSSIDWQLQRFAEINALLAIEDNVKDAQTPIDIPPLSTVLGAFAGEMTFTGDLKSGVNGKFNLNGNNWQWREYKAREFLLQGEFANNVLTILPVELKIGDSLIAFTGQITPENQNGQLRVENVPLAELQKFVQLPPSLVDIGGNLNLQATIAGTPTNPNVVGDINIIDGFLNDQPVQEALGGFSYNEARFRFGGNILVTGEDPITFVGSLPFALPNSEIAPGSELIELKLEMQNEALKIVNALTDQIELEQGKGLVRLEAKGTIYQPELTGVADFSEITLRSPVWDEPLTELQGQILFKGDRIRVSGLSGKISDGEITMAGVLPLIEPFTPDDPDFNNLITLNLNKLDVNFQDVFNGGIDGSVTIGGTAFAPEVGGNLLVADGIVFLNKAQSLQADMATAVSQPNSPLDGDVNNTANNFEIGLNNFQVTLSDRLRLVDPGILNFYALGGLTINGTVNAPEPEGVIDLTSGVINLFSTSLRLDRAYPQTATFVPALGFDPILDVRLIAPVLETYRNPGDNIALKSTEIMDVPIQGSLGTTRKVIVQAIAQGPASQLNENLQLTSSPSRSKQQIVALLGGSVIDTISNDPSLALASVASTTLFSNLQQDIINATGLSEFRIFPARTSTNDSKRASDLGVGVEVGVDITQNMGFSVMQLIGTDDNPELSFRYRLSDRLLLRAGSNFGDNSVMSLEYEIKF